MSLPRCKSKLHRRAVVVDRLEADEMRDAEKTGTEGAALGFMAAVYYTVMLVAFMIGLYGFFSLFWLATSAVGREAQILSLLF
jgi:hypothetical protein